MVLKIPGCLRRQTAKPQTDLMGTGVANTFKQVREAKRIAGSENIHKNSRIKQ